MAKLKKPAGQTPDSESLSARQRAAADLLLKQGSAQAPVNPGTDHATPWDSVRSREEVLAARPPLAPSDQLHGNVSPTDTLAHSNPFPVSDRKGVFVESGNSGKSRVNRSGHKP